MAAAWRVGELIGASVRSSPIVVPAALALAVLVLYAGAQGGYYALDWYPGTVFAFGLLLVALLAIPAAGGIPRAAVAAAGLLGLYAAWSYLSIAWADQQGRAWDGANMAALYAILFALFALWRVRDAPAAVLLGAFALAVALLGLIELLSVDAGREPGHTFVDGQFAGPVGYTNGNAALWTLAIWPALALGSRREVPIAVRPVFLAAAGLLAGFALMGQSRGWLFALVPAAVLFVAVSRGARIRAAIALALVAGAAAAMSGTLLDVRQAIDDTSALEAALGDATAVLLAAAAALGALGLLWALADRRVRPSAERSRAAGVVLVAAAVLAAGIGLAVYNAREGSPVTALSEAWDEFKTGPSPGDERSRFSGGLGSNRYDFWRVAWAEFREHPVGGIGAENFQQAYLERGKSEERARHPHSLPLRVLSQTGIVGALLLAAAIAAALVAAAGAIRRAGALGSLTAAGSTAAFLYWLVHGGVDWFWELPVLGGAAFALLGLACGVAPRAGDEFRRPLVGTLAARVVALGLAVVVGVALVRPWLAELYVERAAHSWGNDREQAFDNLERASDLNPLAVTPPLVEGAIASRLGELEQAEVAFREALDRDSRNAYAMLNLAVIEWELGREADALERMRATLRVDPRYALAHDVLDDMREGELLDVNEVNRRITQRADRLRR